MYAGRVVERAPTRELFYDPQHPYTWGLLGSIPRLDRPKPERLHSIKGTPPSLIQLPPGLQVPAALPARVREVHARSRALENRVEAPGHLDRCWLDVEKKRRLRERDDPRRTRRRRREHERRTSRSIEVRHVKKYFPIRKGLLQREVARVHAVDDVSFAVHEGETLGLVGESGCGKSTLGRTIVRLLEPTAGDVLFRGQDDREARRARSCGRCAARCRWSSRIPYASLNPRKRVGTIIGDPLQDPPIGDKARAEGAGPGAARDGRALARALQPLPARVLGRPAPADRGRPRARPAAEADRRRRAGLGARRLDPVADAEPARGPPERVPADVHLHRPRPRRRAARQRPDRRDVPREARRALAGGGALPRGRSCRTPRRCSRPSRSPIPTWRGSGSGSCSRATCRARSTRRAAAASIPRCRYATEICHEVEPPLVDYGERPPGRLPPPAQRRRGDAGVRPVAPETPAAADDAALPKDPPASPTGRGRGGRPDRGTRPRPIPG